MNIDQKVDVFDNFLLSCNSGLTFSLNQLQFYAKIIINFVNQQQKEARIPTSDQNSKLLSLHKVQNVPAMQSSFNMYSVQSPKIEAKVREPSDLYPSSKQAKYFFVSNPIHKTCTKPIVKYVSILFDKLKSKVKFLLNFRFNIFTSLFTIFENSEKYYDFETLSNSRNDLPRFKKTGKKIELLKADDSTETNKKESLFVCSD